MAFFAEQTKIRLIERVNALPHWNDMVYVKVIFSVTLEANTTLVLVPLENILSHPEPIMITVKLVHARLTAIMTS